MRWLITGAAGQLATDLQGVLRGAEDEVLLARRDELDITDAHQVDAVLSQCDPDVVINAAAYTAVDDAEADEAGAMKVNAEGPAVLAQALQTRSGRLVQVSTDYVFDGEQDGVAYQPGDPTSPRSAYGRSKRAGELAVLSILPERAQVVRTAWLYGAGGANFVATMLRLEATREQVDVVADQQGSPTWSAQLARGLVELGRRGDVPPGVLHCTNAGFTSWFGLAQAIFEEIGADPGRVRPTTTARFPRPAPRPRWSVLSNARWEQVGLNPLPPWRAALREALPTIRASVAGAAA